MKVMKMCVCAYAPRERNEEGKPDFACIFSTPQPSFFFRNHWQSITYKKQGWIWVLSETPKSRSNFDKILIITHLQKPRMDVRWKTKVSPVHPKASPPIQRPASSSARPAATKKPHPERHGTIVFFRMSIIRHGAAFSEHRWLSLFPPSSSRTV